MSKYCIKCGNKLDDTVMFCNRCGTLVDRVASNIESSSHSTNSSQSQKRTEVIVLGVIIIFIGIYIYFS